MSKHRARLAGRKLAIARLSAGLSAGLGVLFAQGAAHADTVQGPALFAKFNTYNQGGNQPGQNASCWNVAGSMPPGRQAACSVTRVRTDVGTSTVTVTNGKPFTEFFDAGYAVFVTAVNSNALCRETATWVPAGTNDLKSSILCGGPNGAPVDTGISWFYRADSWGTPQYGFYNRNFAYARFNRGNPTQLVTAESFTAYNPAGGSITNQKLAAGRYKVTFVGANLANSDGVSSVYQLNNVVAQPTCTGDNTVDCHRAHCQIFSHTTNANDTVVEVRCYANGAARDTDFRVFMGAESHSNQVVADDNANILQGNQYGWANVPNINTNTCLTTFGSVHKNHHTTVDGAPLTLPICSTGTGAYRVNFNSHSGFYKKDTVSAIFSTTSANTYCNLGTVSCGDALCGGAQNVYVDVRCYNNAGNAVNTAWNMSLIYH